MNNILITSAGRRVSLIKSFIEASKKFRTGSKIFITDLNPKTAPSSYFANDSFKVGLFNDPDYVSNLLKLCLKHKISDFFYTNYII